MARCNAAKRMARDVAPRPKDSARPTFPPPLSPALRPTRSNTRRNAAAATRWQGLRQPRITGEGYHSFVAEFMDALRRWQPHMLLQFEDFGNTNAFKVLEDHRRSFCCFNDDIQYVTQSAS